MARWVIELRIPLFSGESERKRNLTEWGECQNVNLTVTDKDGGVTTQTVAVKVDNVAPTIVNIVKPDKLDERFFSRV
jgi:hypothetical protein